nr:BAG family molecular chaperone regulator 4 [Tanacetum cinerariifolium]
MRPLVSPLSLLRDPSVPYASVATFAHSSLLRDPSVPQSGGPRDKLNDNVKTMTDNATHAFNILKTPEFPGGFNGAQPPSAHELIYLQLLKLDGINAEGDGRTQRKSEVRRVQGLVDTLDNLRTKNANPINHAPKPASGKPPMPSSL